MVLLRTETDNWAMREQALYVYVCVKTCMYVVRVCTLYVYVVLLRTETDNWAMREQVPHQQLNSSRLFPSSWKLAAEPHPKFSRVWRNPQNLLLIALQFFI